MNKIEKFEQEKKNNIGKMIKNKKFKSLSQNFLINSIKYKYSYNFKWLGRPIIQYPQDIIAMQEIIWDIKPDLIIETGIAHGGSLIFYASMIELIGRGQVLGIDIDIRDHNRKEIESHPMFKRIKMIEGSSVDEKVFQKVRLFSKNKKTLVCLDSNHTGDHVFKELELYSMLVSKGSYIVVFDTIIEDLPKDMMKNRPWSKGNNPATAIAMFLAKNRDFVIDREIEDKLLISVAPGGYLKRIK